MGRWGEKPVKGTKRHSKYLGEKLEVKGSVPEAKWRKEEKEMIDSSAVERLRNMNLP